MLAALVRWVFVKVSEATGARRVYFNRRYEPRMAASDAATTAALAAQGFELHSFNALLLR